MFAKIFGQILDSSIAQHYDVRRMFMDLLILADSDGVVDMTYEAISRRLNVPLDKVKLHIGELLKPDPESRSKKSDGRRITPLDPRREWGWKIVNYAHYRALRDEEGRRAYFRDYMRDKRAEGRRKGVSSRGKTVNRHQPPVKGALKTVNTCQHPSTKGEGEGDAKKSTPKPPQNSLPLAAGKHVEGVPTDAQAIRFAAIFHRKEGKAWSEKEIAAWKKLRQRGPVDDESLLMVERYYKKHWPPDRDKNILRHDLVTFINNYPGEEDRGRAWCEKHPLSSARKIVAMKPAAPVDNRTPAEIEESKKKAREMVEELRQKMSGPAAERAVAT